MSLRRQKARPKGFSSRWEFQMMATAVMTRKSSPSRKKPSQSRSWVEKGTVLAKRVMYHLVAYAEVEMKLSV